MGEGSTGTRSAARPVSPHVSVWRWHITMAGSILHRATGSALYGGALILVVWVATLAAGPSAFEAFKGLLGSLPGKAVLFVLTFSLFYHMANGVRHLVWDAGKGFEPHRADMTGAGVIAFGAAATLAIWVFAAVSGALA